MAPSRPPPTARNPRAGFRAGFRRPAVHLAEIDRRVPATAVRRPRGGDLRGLLLDRGAAAVHAARAANSIESVFAVGRRDLHGGGAPDREHGAVIRFVSPVSGAGVGSRALQEMTSGHRASQSDCSCVHRTGKRDGDLTLIRRLRGGRNHGRMTVKPRWITRFAAFASPRCRDLPGSIDRTTDRTLSWIERLPPKPDWGSPIFTVFGAKYGNRSLFPSTIFDAYTGLVDANVHTNVHTL